MDANQRAQSQSPEVLMPPSMMLNPERLSASLSSLLSPFFPFSNLHCQPGPPGPPVFALVDSPLGHGGRRRDDGGITAAKRGSDHVAVFPGTFAPLDWPKEEIVQVSRSSTHPFG